MIVKPDSQNPPLPPDLFATWGRHDCINVTWDQSEYQHATREQCSDEQLLRLDIESVHFVNNRRVETSFLFNKKNIFQGPSSVPSH